MLSKLAFLAKLTFNDERAATGLYPEIKANAVAQGGGSLDEEVYDFVHAGTVTIANTGAGITTVDLWAAYVSFAQNTKTNPTLLVGVLFKTSGVPATASCVVSPGATSPARLPISGTPSGSDTVIAKYTMNAGDWWAAGFIGDDKAVDNTHKNVDLSNPGSTAVVIDYYFVLGGGSNS